MNSHIEAVLKQLSVTYDVVTNVTKFHTSDLPKNRQTTRLLNSLYCLKNLQAVDLNIGLRETIVELKHIKQLVKLTNITSLTLRSAKFSQDLFNHLSGLSKIERLTLQSSSESIAWIPTQLTAFDVSFPKVTDWTPLTRLDRIKDFALHYTDNQSFTSLFPTLHKLTALETLSFCESISTVDDIHSICNPNYAHFTSLYIHHDDLAAEALIPIKKLTTLQKLHISETPKDHLSSLAYLTNLTYLCLSTCDSKSLQLLTVLTKLKALQFDTPPPVCHPWFKSIGTLTNLEYLLIDRCLEVKDFNIGHLSNLNLITALLLGNPAKLTARAGNYFAQITSLQSLWYSGLCSEEEFTAIQKQCPTLTVRRCKRVGSE